MLVMEDGQIAYGDCAAVQYSGAGVRDPLFLAKNFISVIEKSVKPILVGREINEFKSNAEELDTIMVEGKRLHTTIRYGISQALLDASAKIKNKLMCEVISEEYGTQISEEMIPIFAQSGDDIYDGVDNFDKMADYIQVLEQISKPFDLIIE